MNTLIREIPWESTKWRLLGEVDRHKKTALVVAGAGALVVFGGSLLPMLGHLLLLLLEVVELLFEHGVEALFGVDTWTAQLITAWTGFFVLLAVIMLTYRWLHRVYLHSKDRYAAWRQEHSLHA
jgi:uncharacterized BrkB/YihY/UPF0761 family membrane protein